MNYKRLEKNLSKLEKLTANYEQLEKNVSSTQNEITDIVISLSKDEVKPDSEDGKKFIDFTNLIRGIGHKILNLLEINITCSFAGATLFTWSLPKIKDNKVVDSIDNKTSKKL